VKDANYLIDSVNPLTWLKAFGHIRSYRPDVVVLQWWVTFWAPVWWALGLLNRFFLHRPILFICHNVLPHEERWWDPVLGRQALRWGSAFSVQSAEEKAKLLALLPEASVEICPHPVYDMLAGERAPKAQARERLGLPLEATILLHFGIVREYKGLADLLAAMPKVRENEDRVLLVIAGEFWDDKQPYIESIRELGIGGTVQVDDRYIPNEEVALYFSAADLLVAPYRRVTGSGPVQMAHGFDLPVVTTDVGDTAAIEAEGLGLLVPAADPGALAAGIIKALGMASRPESEVDVAESRYAWERLVALMESLNPGEAS
jgi:glycosyltransferase involved in cell wall biosynthesis